MSDSIVARLPSPRKSPRRWVGLLLGLLAVPLLVGGVVYAAYPRHSTEADFLQVVDAIVPAEEAAVRGLEAEIDKAGLGKALGLKPGRPPDLAAARRRLADARGLVERRRAADLARLESTRTLMSALRLPATRKAIVMDQAAKDIDAASVYLDRRHAFDTEFLDMAEGTIGFLEQNRSSWSWRDGRLVFTDWYDMHGFAARRARLVWLTEQSAEAAAKALASRKAAVTKGYQWPEAGA